MRPFLVFFIFLEILGLAEPRSVERSAYASVADSLVVEDPGQIRLVANERDEIHKKPWKNDLPPVLQDMLDALEAMQDTYFDLFSGTWPSAIDWTSAVMGTQVSATLGSIVSSLDVSATSTCADMLVMQNIIDRYFAQTSVFYFGENAFGLRNQAYDDMLWVVLGWLENLKFAEMYSLKHWDFLRHNNGWHGLQVIPMAAHRARIFYDLAAAGWDESLCGGGMIWNPYLTPYKNAITNELFAAASIGMYLYFPGDNNTSPYMAQGSEGSAKPHDSVYLENAIKSYKWLMESQMRSPDAGMYQDGFHVTGWHRYPNGTVNPGTGKCDELNRMVYTYNQGVVLSASRGLWIATGARSYLDDGHALVESVIRATGWPNLDPAWSGLGRGGVLEEFCDHGGYCSQDGQTFKGIFFHHLSEFCRPLWAQEQSFLTSKGGSDDFDRDTYDYHLARCAAYDKWVAHNSRAALATKNTNGHFGMWWTFGQPDEKEMEIIHETTVLADDAEDHLNPKLQVWPGQSVAPADYNDRGRGRTVETQSGGLAVLRARWNWDVYFRQISI
ncbi:uncharacterized protein PV06_07865 [Exophiala oligosperma]|uniref:Glycosyl hydrolase n=2 Tax=Chaetothyriales TaxID=34395 RepID=A0A0D2DC58_9EURO|nr:uncharacterized protein PV06_07865 [Exophiala oligosperma]KAJ9645442.1 hypothetical protein H2204_001021 [Knufia peltigerae]KIW40688.1 hypothetical protein PV06_07865 [Exophiala oligosperma]